MVSTWTLVFCIFTLLISLIGPVAALIFYARRHPGEGTVSAWFWGAAGFFVPQMLLRLPLLQALSGRGWFLAFSQNHLFLYVFSLAVTAGLFELAGRLAVANILRKKLTWPRALAAGLGHGGVEAMVIVGLAYVNNLIFIVLLNTGAFDALTAQLAAAGQDTAQLEAARAALVGTPPATFLLAGVERMLTMVIQAGMSALICWGVHRRRTGKAILGCLAIHTLIDLTAGISLLATPAGGNKLSQGAAYAVVYAVLILAAGLSLALLRAIRRRWEPEKEEIIC